MRGQPTISIRLKLVGLVFAVVGTLVIGVTFFFSEQQLEAEREDLQEKAELYAKLYSRSLAPAVAFGDRVTAREELEALRFDSEVHAVALFRADGSVIASTGDVAAPDHSPDEIEITTTAEHIAATAIVISREGPRGTLVVEISTAPIAALRKRVIYTSAIATVIALAFGLAASWFIGASIARRLRKIQGATRDVANGQLDVSAIDDTSRDEIGRLARDFNTMASHIRELVAKVSTRAQEEQTRLDGLVEARTLELSARNEALRLVLHNVDQGFLTLDRPAFPSHERSAIVSRWFGNLREDESLWTQLAGVDKRAAMAAELMWDAVFEGVLPPAVAIDQLPTRMRVANAELELEYRPIFEGESEIPIKILLIVSDVTADVARRRAEASQGDLTAIFSKLIADRSVVEEFVGEARSLMSALDSSITITDPDPMLTRRCLHTLKGNASFLGLAHLSSACHEIETVIDESGAVPAKSAFEGVFVLWTEIARAITPFLRIDRDRLEIATSEIEAIARDLLDGVEPEVVARTLLELRLEATDDRLARVAEQTHAIARRLGKDPLDVRVSANGVRLAAERWAPFWSSFIHVIRNAVDHGVEEPSVRRQVGKPDGGTIVLRAFDAGPDVVIEVEDDGAGVDWDRLRARAGERASSMNETDLLFLDGVTTKDEVTDVSGRGVGLGAARVACEAMGGKVVVRSIRGKGTRFSFVIPRDRVDEPRLPSRNPSRLSNVA